MKLPNWLFIALVTGVPHTPMHGQQGLGHSEAVSIVGMKNAAVAFYVGEEQEPAAVLRVRQIHRDYQRKGFFRIGLLPMAAFEGVRVEIYHPESAASSLVQCHEWLNSRSGGRLELRDVRLAVIGHTTNWLACGVARPSADGRWELSEGVTFASDTRQIQAVNAVLQAVGP